MATIAIYSLKGGVGKTTLAVNLAFASASASRRTLLWDLDPQAASTWLLGGDAGGGDVAQAVFARDVSPLTLVRPTAIPLLDILPSDTSLRGLDQFFAGLGKRRRLSRLIEQLLRDYDRIILDCPPGLTETSEQVVRAATLILAPVIPSPLSQRALAEVVGYFDRTQSRHAPILPIFSMVDRRRGLHNQAVAAEPDWPVVPMASAVEQMAVRRLPLAAFAPASPAAQAVTRIWTGIERKLATSG